MKIDSFLIKLHLIKKIVVVLSHLFDENIY